MNWFCFSQFSTRCKTFRGDRTRKHFKCCAQQKFLGIGNVSRNLTSLFAVCFFKLILSLAKQSKTMFTGFCNRLRIQGSRHCIVYQSEYFAIPMFQRTVFSRSGYPLIKIWKVSGLTRRSRQNHFQKSQFDDFLAWFPRITKINARNDDLMIFWLWDKKSTKSISEVSIRKFSSIAPRS